MNDKNATAYRQYKNAKLPMGKTILLLPVLAHITRVKYMSPQTLNCFVRIIIILETKYFAIKSNKGEKALIGQNLEVCVGHFTKQ